MTKKLHDVRCPKCGKLACKTGTRDAVIEIKCKGCKTVFVYDGGEYKECLKTK